MPKIKFDFSPFKYSDYNRNEFDDSDQIRIEELVSDYVVESMLAKIEDTQSPVGGEGRFKPLSKEYKAFKRDVLGTTKANLSLSGDMLESLHIKFLQNNRLQVTVTDEEQDKADGHCNFSGRSRLPKRRFIPNASEKQDFIDDIQKGIAAIIDKVKNG